MDGTKKKDFGFRRLEINIYRDRDKQIHIPHCDTTDPGLPNPRRVNNGVVRICFAQRSMRVLITALELDSDPKFS